MISTSSFPISQLQRHPLASKGMLGTGFYFNNPLYYQYTLAEMANSQQESENETDSDNDKDDGNYEEESISSSRSKPDLPTPSPTKETTPPAPAPAPSASLPIASLPIAPSLPATPITIPFTPVQIQDFAALTLSLLKSHQDSLRHETQTRTLLLQTAHSEHKKRLDEESRTRVETLRQESKMKVEVMQEESMMEMRLKEEWQRAREGRSAKFSEANVKSTRGAVAVGVGIGIGVGVGLGNGKGKLKEEAKSEASGEVDRESDDDVEFPLVGEILGGERKGGSGSGMGVGLGGVVKKPVVKKALSVAVAATSPGGGGNGKGKMVAEGSKDVKQDDKTTPNKKRKVDGMGSV